jgi:hypothetical protein
MSGPAAVLLPWQGVTVVPQPDADAISRALQEMARQRQQLIQAQQPVLRAYTTHDGGNAKILEVLYRRNQWFAP